MMLHGQLGRSQTQPVLFDAPTLSMHVPGLLANEVIQIPARITAYDVTQAAYGNFVMPSNPAFRLGLLKKQRFTSQGRDRRIAASLEAVDAPSPTKLTSA